MSQNTWPHGIRKPLTQSEHEHWNSYNYPGTRQLCSACELPTGNCEEDGLFDDNGNPYCNGCYQIVLIGNQS